jgi:hypothetical protein
MQFDRALRFLDGDQPPDRRASKVRAFEIILLLIMGTEYWARAVLRWNDLSPLYGVSLASASVCCVVGLATRWRRVAFAGLALTQGAVIWAEFPGTGNHAYLELLFCMLCAFLNDRGDEQQLFLRAVRWMVCVVLFWGGVQKVVNGFYSQGQYVAYSLSTDSFRQVLQPLLPAEEVARLRSYKGEVGDGPYLISSPLLLVFCHSVYIVELALVPLLLIPATRKLAVVGAVVFMLGIEAAAREVFFGLVFVNAILLFLPSDTNRRLIGVFAGGLALLMLSRLGALPEVTFY